MFLKRFRADSFEADFLLVVIIHLLLVMSIFFSSFIWNKFIWSQSKIRHIKSAVRVDIVAMPKLTLQELKKIRVKLPEKELAEEKAEIKNQKSKIEYLKKEKKIDLNNLLKDISDEKPSKSPKLNIKKADSKTTNKDLQKLILEGNILSKGSSITGEKSTAEMALLDRYLQEILNRVKPYWKLPTYLINKNLQCRIRLYIGRNGNLIKAEFFQKSGNDEYDKRAMDAIKKVPKFSIPDKSIVSKLINGYAVLGFPL